MDLLEYQGKQLLREAEICVPQGAIARSPEEAATIAGRIGGRVAVKSQIAAGGRGASGGIRFASNPAEAEQAAHALLGSNVRGFEVRAVLVEAAVEAARELYAAVVNDPASKGPVVLFSAAGGMDIEEINEASPEQVLRVPVDIRHGLSADAAEQQLARTDLASTARAVVAATLVQAYQLYRAIDAELIEINPLAVTRAGEVVALDAKISLDSSALARHGELLGRLGAGEPDQGTEIERMARDLGLHLIELDGNVGVLANGAGLTMATLDAVSYYGGAASNFLEIGGDAYTKATPALRLVLSNPKVGSLLVNFCGAFARTDVMTDGVIAALEELRPDIQIIFCIHGTGEREAIQMVRERLGIEPYNLMDAAVLAAVAAASRRETVA